MAVQAENLLLPGLSLVHPLVRGGMGSIWVANHLVLGTQVAVKFMAPELAKHCGFVERFRQEALAVAQIKSPHVAQVFDHGVTSHGVPYIVMELLEGENLKSRMLRLGALSLLDVASIISQTAKALGRAHQLGIVHRDIKPDNLFLIDVGGEPFVKVLDFGIAKQTVLGGDLGATVTGVMMGTPWYMSPEQILSTKHVDFRTDLWSLGIVAYRALTAKLPFMGETPGAVAVAIHGGVFTAPSQVRPDLPPAIDAWMQKALHRDPAARFGSAREMARALLQAADPSRTSMHSFGDLTEPLAAAGSDRRSHSDCPPGAVPPVQGPTLTSMARTTPRLNRNGLSILLAATALALTMGLTGGIWYGLNSPPDLSEELRSSGGVTVPSSTGLSAVPTTIPTREPPERQPDASAPSPSIVDGPEKSPGPKPTLTAPPPPLPVPPEDPVYPPDEDIYGPLERSSRKRKPPS